MGHPPAAAREEFVALTGRPDAVPEWFRVWSELQADETERRHVLEAGTTRFPEHAPLQEALAVSAWAAGDRSTALKAAAAALAIDGSRTGAWIVTVSASASPEVRLERLRLFDTGAVGEPAARLAMADVVAGFTRSPEEPAAVLALGWVESMLTQEPEQPRAIVVKARLQGALGRVPDALHTIASVIVGPLELPSALKLHAELLLAAGRYEEAVAAFDRYLTLAPRDLPVRRQQARVDGWRGAYDESLGRYQRLRADHPDVPAVAAEVDAKRAYYAGRWREAAERYTAWLALEPDAVEARLELAQIYDRLGEPARAAEGFRVAFRRGAPHDVSQAAADRLERRRRPSADFFAVSHSADAVERGQLLNLVDSGAGISDDLGRGYGTRVRAFGGPSFADVGDHVWHGQHVGGQLTTMLRAPLRLSGSLAYRKLDTVGGQWFGDLGLAWRASNVRLSVGVERSLLLENRSTLTDGISGFGLSTGVRWAPNDDVYWKRRARSAA